jgi:hypothetical protein
MNGLGPNGMVSTLPGTIDHQSTVGASGVGGYIPGVGYVSPYGGTDMLGTGSDLSEGFDMAGATGSMSTASMTMAGYEPSYKKRACDQCNHSKVRCDFGEPCGMSYVLMTGLY